jgi:hypothetical protein
MKLIAVLLAVLALVACLDPKHPKGGIPQPGWTSIAAVVNERPARDWVDENVVWQHHDDMFRNNGHRAWAWVPDHVLHIDAQCDDGYCWQNQADFGWWLWHEIGHTMPYVWGPPSADGGVAEERKAMCVAEVITGRGPTFTQPTNGYWDCPAAEVNAIRAWMVSLGVAV